MRIALFIICIFFISCEEPIITEPEVKKPDPGNKCGCLADSVNVLKK
jgi:hypothetical protein